MLYLNINPYFFSFNIFSSTPLLHFSTSQTLHIQKMECSEGGFKRGEADEFLLINNQNDTTVEHFSVEDLFVDGEDEFLELETGENHGVETEEKTPCSVLPKLIIEQVMKTDEEKSSGFSSSVDDFGSVPADDVAELEWLSNFMEDSNSEYSMTCPPGKILEKVTTHSPKPNPAQECLTSPAQTKSRSKRARTGGRVWSSESYATSSSTESSICIVYHDQPTKKKKRISSDVVAQAPVTRRCSHCGVQKTPQWRAGSQGAKTLCNACGVRFKSGRLFPEYRPACSPTFSSEKHSNNHRKVLEMRNKKKARPEVFEGIRNSR